jgi:hypothetical protein
MPSSLKTSSRRSVGHIDWELDIGLSDTRKEVLRQWKSSDGYACASAKDEDGRTTRDLNVASLALFAALVVLAMNVSIMN